MVKNEACALYRRRTLVFHDGFKQPVSKTLCFCGRFGLIWSRRGPVDCRLGCTFFPKSMQKMGFRKHGQEKHMKTQGPAPGNRRSLVFYGIFLSLRRALLGFSWFVYPDEEPPGPPPLAWPQNRHFHTKALIAGSHFHKADRNRF